MVLRSRTDFATYHTHTHHTPHATALRTSPIRRQVFQPKIALAREVSRLHDFTAPPAKNLASSMDFGGIYKVLEASPNHELSFKGTLLNHYKQYSGD